MTDTPTPSPAPTHEVVWVLPPGITLQQAEAAPGTQMMFPQTLTTLDTAPCGSVLQIDVYSGDSSTITADSTLSWVNGHPEDSAIYQSHTFTTTPACVVVTPSPTPSPTPTPIIEVPVTPPASPTPVLAETGADSWALILVSLAALVSGVTLVRKARR